jgi:anti-sigma factor RsiW
VELTCREFIEDLADYLSGELAPDRLSHCEAHLFHCPDCVNYYWSYRGTIRLSKMALDEGDESTALYLPPELARSILAAARRTKG